MTTIDMITPRRWTFLAMLHANANVLDRLCRGIRSDMSIKEKNRADSNESDHRSRLRLPPELVNRIELRRSDFMSSIR